MTVILPTEVDIAADTPDAYELGPVSGNFTLTRNGDTNDLTVYLAISGTASNSVDYVTLTNVVTFAGGLQFPRPAGDADSRLRHRRRRVGDRDHRHQPRLFHWQTARQR